MSEQQPKGLFTPGFAHPNAGLVMGFGILAAVLSFATRSAWLLYVAIVIVALGGLIDLLSRVASRRAMRVALFFFAFAVAGMATHPALMWQWMGVLALHANNLLGGK